MPELIVSIGGRRFPVVCAEGEEQFLRAAAAKLDAEAQPLLAQMGRLPEAKLLLMSGLLLADRTAAVEDENRALRARVNELESRAPEKVVEKVVERVEVPVVPAQLAAAMADLAARAEALANRAEAVAKA